MNLNKYTEKGTGSHHRAQQLAEREHTEIEPEHLLVTLLEQRTASCRRSCAR